MFLRLTGCGRTPCYPAQSLGGQLCLSPVSKRKAGIINSTECAAAAAEVLTRKAAVTAALALSIEHHGILLSQSNGTRANLIFVINTQLPGSLGFLRASFGKKGATLGAGSFVTQLTRRPYA